MHTSQHRASTATRRTFLKRVMLGSAVLGTPTTRALAAAMPPNDSPSPRVKQYKRLGSTAINMSDISFGASSLDRDVRLIHHALERGINYFDTADSYTHGASEETLGTALHGRRDTVYLASKAVFQADTGQEEMMQALEGSLRRLRTDYIDVYFQHAVNNVRRLHNPAFYTFVERAKQQGKIRYVGLSGHSGRLIECLEYAIGTGKFDVMLVAYNFGQEPSFLQRFSRGLDFVAVNPALPRVIRQAKAAGMGVIAMKTLRGARLHSMAPYQKDGATFAQAAFRWVLSNRHVDALVVTMQSPGQVDEFVGASGSVKVTQSDSELLRRYVALNDSTYCRPLCNTCEPACPEQVPVADVLRHKMYYEDYGSEHMAMAGYATLPHNAAACLTCAHQRCLQACPYGLPVPELTRQAHRILHRSAT
jgi:predicted aldo/keto reductase-like oxidoreductase